MTKSVVLITGFLGAGKTTFINQLLVSARGIRLAAIVNDFGSVNIDVELIAAKADSVIGLKNGCICCSLQGDLLRTLKQVVSWEPPCDYILIEASGVADPQGIVETLMDPVFLQAVRLDTIVCVVDIEMLTDNSRLRDDPLWQAQLVAADFIALAKSEEHREFARMERERLMASGKALVFDAASPPPLGILLRDSHARSSFGCGPVLAADRFATLEWSWDGSIRPDSFQQVIGELAPHLVRAKGIVNFENDVATSFVFHLVGRHASIEPLGRRQAMSQLVLIGEAASFDAKQAKTFLSENLGPAESATS